MPTRCNRWFLLQILLLAQHVSGTIMPIIRCSRVLYRWLLPVVFGEGCVPGLRASEVKQQPANRTHNPQLHTIPTSWKTKHQIPQAATICIILSILMMGIMVPETCWASNKICNKNHLLHLVGILIPHINDDARSKSLQIDYHCFNEFLMNDANNLWDVLCGDANLVLFLRIGISKFCVCMCVYWTEIVSWLGAWAKRVLYSYGLCVI
jgi:hypothetical protein